MGSTNLRRKLQFAEPPTGTKYFAVVVMPAATCTVVFSDISTCSSSGQSSSVRVSVLLRPVAPPRTELRSDRLQALHSRCLVWLTPLC